MICASRVNRRFTLLDVPDDALFIDRKRSACAVTAFLVEDAVISNHLAFEIAQQRKRHLNVFGETFVGCVAVRTDSQNLRAALLKFGNIRLIRLQFLRSAAGEGENVKGEYDVLFTSEITELDRLPGSIGQRKIGRFVSDLQMSLGRDGRLRCGTVVCRD